MSDYYKYKAFGLVISSPFEIVALPKTDNAEIDVSITESDLSALDIEKGCVYTKEDIVYFCVDGLAKFRICGGKTIEVDRFTNCDMSRLLVYIMGSCMGAILQRHGYMLLHGSCVTDGKHAVLITGDSGAGKSTLAAEFLSHGYKLLTDDVSAITDTDTVPTVVASYPSQKLWGDSMLKYGYETGDVHSLYRDGEREKFGINVKSDFADTSCPLSLIVRLIPTDNPCVIEEITGATRIDQIMRNTYRPFMIPQSARETHFRRCISLAVKVPMAVLTRQRGEFCADTLYRMITDFIGDKNNG